jgi:hypothetical protein
MNLIEVVILAGAHCLSPVEAAPATTIAGKVPCAVLIRLDEETGNVEFTPPAARSNPQVIAMLVKPGQPEEPAGDTAAAPVAEGDSQEPAPAAEAALDAKQEGKPQVKRAKQAEEARPAKKAERRKTASATRKQRARKRNDACGSYKAVWYTNKEGRRKYRCVRTG